MGRWSHTAVSPRAPNEGKGVLGDHPLLVGRDDPDPHAASAGVEMRGPPVRWRPRRARSRATRRCAQTRGADLLEFSPIPAVKTSASSPPSAAGERAELPADAVDE